MMAFRSPKGVFYYQVVPFGLKNVEATYQKAMTIIFREMFEDTMDCYVDDLVVKSKSDIRQISPTPT